MVAEVEFAFRVDHMTADGVGALHFGRTLFQIASTYP